MTRINVGIKPAELPDKLLLAELREIKRIPNMVKSGRAKLDNIPSEFVLGHGHVKFFYNKLRYLYDRYCFLYHEAKEVRGFNVTSFHNCWDDIDSTYMGYWVPYSDDRKKIVERILSKGFKLHEIQYISPIKQQ